MARPTALLFVAAVLAAIPVIVPAAESDPHAGAAMLARSADTIVLGACDDGVSRWSGTPPVIVTLHQCRVERSFKGSSGDTVPVQVLGGRIGDVQMSASAGATLTPGADVVLMLRRSQFGSYYVIAGGAQGMLPVAAAPQRSVRGMSIDDFAHWVNAEVTP